MSSVFSVASVVIKPMARVLNPDYFQTIYRDGYVDGVTIYYHQTNILNISKI